MTWIANFSPSKTAIETKIPNKILRMKEMTLWFWSPESASCRLLMSGWNEIQLAREYNKFLILLGNFLDLPKDHKKREM